MELKYSQQQIERIVNLLNKLKIAEGIDNAIKLVTISDILQHPVNQQEIKENQQKQQEQINKKISKTLKP